MTRYIFALCLAMLLCPILALAADPASVVSSPQAFADALTAALSAGQYRIAVGIVLAGLVWLLRDKALANLPGKVGAWLSSPRGGVVIILAAGALATLSLRLLAAAPLHLAEVPGLLVNCIATGLMAAGGWSVLTKWQAKPPAVPPAAPVAALLCLLLSATACNPRQVVAWQQLGADSLGCLSPGLSGALSGAVDGAIKEIGGSGADWGAYGRGLVTSYGGAAALCIVQQAIARLGPVIFGGAPDNDPRLGLRWLDAHRDQWLK